MYSGPTSTALTECKLLEPSAYVDGIIDQIPESHKNNASSGHLKKILCGGLAGVVSRTCTAPLDRLKVLLQVQGQQRVVGNRQNMGAIQMLRAMWREGIFTMWKGNLVNCMKIFPENAVRLYIFELLNETQIVTKNPLWHIHGDKLSKFSNGAFTGIFVQTFMYPVEIIKTRIMTFPSKLGNMGVFQASKRIWNETGNPRFKGIPIFNFYKGFTPAIIGVMPFAALELGCSKLGTEWYKEHFNTKVPGFYPLLGIGTTSSFIAMGATYPFRLITCQMQAYTGPEKDRLGPRAHAAKILKTEGYKGFYRGFLANSSKAVPSSGIAWATFNITQQYWDRWSSKTSYS